jgi:hypothetical protein
MRLSPGSSPFFLPPWGSISKRRQGPVTEDSSAPPTPFEDRPMGGLTGSLRGAATCFDRLEVNEHERGPAEQLANLLRKIAVATTSKRRRMMARRKRRS